MSFMLISCLAYSLILKWQATCSSETLVDFQQTTWHCIPQVRISDHCCENLRAYDNLWFKETN
jgi:hypothetical protein